MPNLLILGHQLTLYAGRLPDIGLHHHSASALCIGLSGPLRARDGADGDWQDHRELFVPAGVRHALAFGGQPVAVLFFETQSRIYRQWLMHHRLSVEQLGTPTGLPIDWLDEVRSAGEPGTGQPETLLGRIVAQLLPTADMEDPGPVDERVRQVLALMQAEPHRNFSAAVLAAHTCLSASRLSALFMRDMGLPLRRYRVWLRLRSMVRFVDQGMTLTDAAQMAGFSDSAHFSNSCRKLLGVKPTDLWSAGGELQIVLSPHW